MIKPVRCLKLFCLLLFILPAFRTLSVPTLGSYQPMIVGTSNDTLALPDAAPSGTTSIIVSTSTSFTGILTADPVTGNVSIVNPKPAGNYECNELISIFVKSVATMKKNLEEELQTQSSKSNSTIETNDKSKI